MDYELQIEDVSSIRRRLRFTLPGDVVKSELDLAYRTLSRRVRLPGFRPGKVPRNVLEARYGRQIVGDVSAKLIEDSYKLASADLDVAGQPAVEERGDIAGGQPFTFTIAVDVKPVVEATNYTGLKVDYPVSPVADEAVERAMSRELAGRARIEEISEDRGVEAGDLVLTELKLTSGDDVLAEEPGTMIHTRDERYYKGVEGLLTGLKRGETATGSVTIAADSALAHLAGVTAEATVKVVGIQAHRTPELSDEVAGELGYEGGAEGMKTAVRARLQDTAEATARDLARANLLEKLVAGHTVEVPKAMIEEQFQLLVEELKIRRAYGGQDPRRIRFSDAELDDLRTRARFAARASSILAAVARQENLVIADEELNDKIREIADLRGQAVEAIRAYLEREGAVEMLRSRLLEERTLEWLMEQSELVPVDPAKVRDAKDADGEGDAAAQQAALTEDAAQAPAEAAPAAEDAPAAEAAPADSAAQAEEATEG